MDIESTCKWSWPVYRTSAEEVERGGETETETETAAERNTKSLPVGSGAGKDRER